MGSFKRVWFLFVLQNKIQSFVDLSLTSFFFQAIHLFLPPGTELPETNISNQTLAKLITDMRQGGFKAIPMIWNLLENG